VAEDALSVLELSSMAPLARYPYSSVMTFGGCQDDFMLVVGTEDTLAPNHEQKLLFAMSKPKILEITLLIADYMNALGHTCPGTPQMNTLTRNGSHRSIRSRPHGSTTAVTTAHNTLNSHGTHTLNSHGTHTLNSHGTHTLNSHSHTLNSHHSHTLSSSHGSHGSHGVNTISNSIHSSNGSHQQPDILKSTPDHQRIK
jgi:hypothetical protein